MGRKFEYKISGATTFLGVEYCLRGLYLERGGGGVNCQVSNRIKSIRPLQALWITRSVKKFQIREIVLSETSTGVIILFAPHSIFPLVLHGCKVIRKFSR